MFFNKQVPENEALTAPLTPQRTVFNPGPATASSPYNSPSGKVEQIAQKSLLQLSTAASASAAWMKEKAAFAFSRVGSGKKEHPISSFNYNAALAGAAGASSAYGGTNTAASGRDGASHLAATASPSGSMHGGGHQLPDPNGIPVKVTVHRKSVKELADLRLVQEIQGHQVVPIIGIYINYYYPIIIPIFCLYIYLLKTIIFITQKHRVSYGP